MTDQLFLFEIFSTKLLIRDTALVVVENLMNTALEGHEPKTGPQEAEKKVFAPTGDDVDKPFSGLEENSVAVIPLNGIMMKYDRWWTGPGCDSLADLIRQDDRSANIAGTLLLINTPGGTTTAVIQMEDALRNRTKPCVALIDGECNSGGIYVASFCDEIHSVNRMCEAGSIGTYAQIVDTSEAEKKWGYKIIQIYPPESKYKNLEVREALKGKRERIIRESLTPYAIHFQNIIKENRRKLDTSVEGILEGRVFYAYDAITYGLIDGLMNMEQAIERVRRLAEEKKSFYSQFNN